MCDCKYVCVCQCLPKAMCLMCVCISHQFCVKRAEESYKKKDAGSVGHSTNGIVETHTSASLSLTHTHIHIQAVWL